MTLLVPDTDMGDLEINSQSLNTGGFMIADITRLWSFVGLRGADRELPGGGSVKYPRRARGASVTLPMQISRTHDSSGSAYVGTTLAENFASNINFLRTNVTDPPNLGTFPDGAYPAVLTMPDGVDTRTATVNEFALTIGQAAAGLVFCTISFNIVEGVFS